MANRCENILVVSGENVTPFIELMDNVESGTFCYDKPFVEYDSEDKVQFSFDTAWKPCLEWLIQQSRIHSALTFDLSYHEAGCFMCGTYYVENGEVLCGQHYEEKNEKSLNFLKDVFGFDNYPC